MDREAIASGWTPARIDALRQQMSVLAIEGLIIPRWDAHQSEYVLPRDERLAWATGFTGSWGLAVVLTGRAALFVDGRYTVQAKQEVDPEVFEIRHLYDEPPERWLAETAGPGDRIGFDAMTVAHATYEAVRTAVEPSGASLLALGADPFDHVWSERPRTVPGPILPFPLEHAGETSRSKRQRLAEELRTAGLDLLVDSQPDNLAWLLNLRAADLPYLPAPQGFLIADSSGGLELFVDERRLPSDCDPDLSDIHVQAPESLLERVRLRASGGRRVAVDPRFAPVGAVLAAHEAGGVAAVVANPLTALKARKSDIELAGMRSACRRDAVAWVRFLAWLDAEVARRDEAGAPSLVELEAEEVILGFRRELELFVGPSFRSISAAGPNAAICHYAAPATGGGPIRSDRLYLLDSGGQFLDGTTDLTRTVCFSPPEAHLRRAFTLVLKGHIALARQRFPASTCGYQLDALARTALWSEGLDYDHGTGHGVGHHLSVHEHPQRVGKEPLPVRLEPGMIVTIEPGHYVADQYGIRVENMYEVVGEPGGWMRFAPISFVPICRELVDPDLLDPSEAAWLDDYHERCREEAVVDALSPEERGWLERATIPLGPRRHRLQPSEHA